MLDVIAIWCQKWQSTPQALKCECLVFENTGMTCPTLQFAGAVLPVVQSVLYLGYQLSHRGTWKQHVDRRGGKADKWDGVARAMLGKTGGPPVSVVATVRDATAEAGILYGAEFTGGTGTSILAAAEQRQIEMAKEILGLRASAENVGAMLELGWMGIESKAKRARLMFWWRLGRTESTLMQELEKQAHEHKLEDGQITKRSQYNWWRCTDELVEHIAKVSRYSAAALRAMSRETFRRIVNHTLWREEYDRRLGQCRSSTRLETCVTELQHLAADDAAWDTKRTRWPGAPYLAYVDNKFHARLLAMTRLGLLPIEIETGRWHGIPRAERLCQMCGKCIGDTKHFLHGCERLTAERVKSLESKATYTEARGKELFFWRGVARRVECRWRERTSALRKQQDEPAHPAEANDAEVCEKIDSIIGQKSEPPTEKPANISMKEPHGKGAAKPRKKLQKRPRSFWHDGKHHIVK